VILADFTVAGITFIATAPAIAISYAQGDIQYGFGADGKGTVGFTEVKDNLTTLDGKAISITTTNNEIMAKDSTGKLIFQVQFTPSTGKWEYFEYQKYLIKDGVGEVLDIGFKVVDADGDGKETTIQIGVDNDVPMPPVISAETITAYMKKGLDNWNE
jgi:hypothetical protein